MNKDQATETQGANPLSQVRRSPMEMVCDILGVLSQGPTKPTHILYRANMSWKVLSSYLDYLISKGMIEKEGDDGKRIVYKLTEKGRSILATYDELRHSLAGGDANGSVSNAELRQQASWPWL